MNAMAGAGEQQNLWRQHLGVLAEGFRQSSAGTKERAVAERDRLRAEGVRLTKAGYDDLAEATFKMANQIDGVIRAGEKRMPRPEGFGPTPETAYKAKKTARYDPIRKMVRLGHLALHHERAADKIAAIYEAVTRSLFAKSGGFAGGARGMAGPAGLRLSEREFDTWFHVYRPWAEWMKRGAFWVCDGCGYCHHDGRPPRRDGVVKCASCGEAGTVRRYRASLKLVIDVAIDGVSVKTARAKRGKGYPRALILLRCGLEAFDRLWTQRRDSALE